MFIELQVQMGTSERRVYLRTGETRFSNHASTAHSHAFTEVHVVAEGEVAFDCKGKPYVLKAGTLLAVPPHTIHACTTTDDNNLYANFYVDIPLKQPVMQTIEPALVSAFIQTYIADQNSGNYARLAAFIALLSCHVFESVTATAERMTDHSMAISDYFNRCFADASLSELARQLYLSEKQTERLVFKYTGRTFKQNVAYHRIQTATALLQAGRMSKKAVAEYVGYATYGGFYKALREYGEDVGPHKE